MPKDYCQHVAFLATKSVLYEVSVTPKPGLVDRSNSGAHTDMDFYTFMASSASLPDGFYECALAGANFAHLDLRLLLDQIRPIGIKTEERMFNATDGVNTHKGIIFSLGVISAAAGYLFSQKNVELFSADEVCAMVSQMTQGISGRELAQVAQNKVLTNGERLFQKYQLKGIRGEVESGFWTVREKGLDWIRKAHQATGAELNNLLIQALLNIMTCCEDSNIVARHGLETLHFVQRTAREFIEAGGIFAPGGYERVLEMDQDFIQKRISPGGSADLLAVTMMLAMLEGIRI